MLPLNYQVILSKGNEGAKRASEFTAYERDWLTICNFFFFFLMLRYNETFENLETWNNFSYLKLTNLF